MAPIVIVLFGVFVLMTRLMFRREFAYNPDRVAEVLALDPRSRITDARMLRRCLAVLALVVVAFTVHTLIDLEPAVVALLGAGLMVLVTGVGPDEFVRDVEWGTLVFFMALFVLVGGLVESGVIGHIGSWIVDAVGENLFGAATVLLWGSAVFGAFFDNIPYTATMAPIVADLAAQAPDAAAGDSLWWAFTLGADLGGNGTAIAASANVVVLSMAARTGNRISFWQFTKYGIVTTLVTTALAWGYVWLRYFS
jgi:Na+/H+ antiporter NhaD/arsenite permease-like protein